MWIVTPGRRGKFTREWWFCARRRRRVRRILLNSATARISNGLANSSGALGHYLTAHVRSAAERGNSGVWRATYAGWADKPVGIYRSEVSQFERAGAYENLLGDRRSVGHSASWDYCPRRPTGQTWWPRRKAAGLDSVPCTLNPCDDQRPGTLPIRDCV